MNVCEVLALVRMLMWLSQIERIDVSLLCCSYDGASYLEPH